MTLDNLMDVYFKASVREPSEEGIRAVVTALRDSISTSIDGFAPFSVATEFERMGDEAFIRGCDAVRFMLNEILAPRENEKAAGGPTSDDGRSDDPNAFVKPSADPVVCVWKRGRDVFDGTRWGLPSCCAWTYAGVDYETCPNCNKPIRFEAKP